MKKFSLQKILIAVLLLVLSLTVGIGAGTTLGKYFYSGEVGTFNLSLTAGDSGEVDPDAEYTLVYHTFDETGADVVYKTEKIYENESVTIEAAPKAHSDLTFLGWSPLACHDDDLDSYTYDAGSSIIENENSTHPVGEIVPYDEIIILAEKYANEGTIHFYDLYEEYYFTLGDVYLNSSSKSNVAGIEPNTDGYSLRIAVGVEEAKANFQDTVATGLTLFYYSKEDSAISAGGMHARYRFSGRNLYVHPGVNVAILGEVGGGSSKEHDDTYNLKESYGTTVMFDTEDPAYKDKAYSGSSNFCVLPIGRYKYLLNLEVAYSNELVKKPSSSGGSGGQCFAAGTLITMADGSQLPVEALKLDDLVRVYDHENGCYTAAPILFIENDGYGTYNVIQLEFSDGTNLGLIYEHGLFDLDLNQYIYITEANYADFVGHRFAVETDGGYGEVVLCDAYMETVETRCYSLTTQYHMNYFVDGLFSMPGGIPGLFNFFTYGENLAYDKELMASDIETYGLFTYEDFAAYMSEETFDSIFPIKYLKVSIGKGLTTFERLEYIIERYIYRHGLDVKAASKAVGVSVDLTGVTNALVTANGDFISGTLDTVDGVLLLDFEADEGYLLPEYITICIDSTPYPVSTTGGEITDGIYFDIESGSLYIPANLLTDGSLVSLTIEAVEDVPEEKPESSEEGEDPAEEESTEPEPDTPAEDEGTEPNPETPAEDEGSEPAPDAPAEDEGSEPDSDVSAEGEEPTDDGNVPAEDEGTEPESEAPAEGESGEDGTLPD